MPKPKHQCSTSRIPTQHPWSSYHHYQIVSHILSHFHPPDERDIPKFEVLATLQRQLCLCLAWCALQSQDNLLRSLGLLVENRLGLTTITRLLSVITTLSLCEKGCLQLSQMGEFVHLMVRGYLSSLVLRNFMLCVLSALLALAVGASGFWDVDL